MEGINRIMEEKQECRWLMPVCAETAVRHLSCCAGSLGAGRAGGEQELSTHLKAGRCCSAPVWSGGDCLSECSFIVQVQ